MKCKKPLFYILLVTAFIITLPMQGDSKNFEECSLSTKSGLVVASFFSNPLYFISKMMYALNGSVVAAGINLFSLGFAQDKATVVGFQAVNGDWIVHPRVFTREKDLEFVGKDEPVKALSLSMK